MTQVGSLDARNQHLQARERWLHTRRSGQDQGDRVRSLRALGTCQLRRGGSERVQQAQHGGDTKKWSAVRIGRPRIGRQSGGQRARPGRIEPQGSCGRRWDHQLRGPGAKAPLAGTRAAGCWASGGEREAGAVCARQAESADRIAYVTGAAQ